MEHYSIHLTQSAQADIRDIAGYISLELRVPLTAKKLLRRFREAISSLETMPERYALVSDGYLATRGSGLCQWKSIFSFTPWTAAEGESTSPESSAANGTGSAS